MEHTARHLLYARFWVQFLYNIGLVTNKEMIDIRVSHGMILGYNNEKMSKMCIRDRHYSIRKI